MTSYILGKNIAIDKSFVVWREKTCDGGNTKQEEEIFNKDETCLFFRMMPHKTMKFKREKFVDIQPSKERLTILVITNIIRLEKVKLDIIGKAEQPFRNVESLTIEYENNPKTLFERKNDGTMNSFGTRREFYYFQTTVKIYKTCLPSIKYHFSFSTNGPRCNKFPKTF